MHSFLASIAVKAVREYLGSRKIISPGDVPAEFLEKAGVFVCLKKAGMLRGCIGTFEPACSNIAEETIHNAISAAVRDPRFAPVTLDEIPLIEFSVDVLSTPEEASFDDLDSSVYGVIVESGCRKGLLLPALEGVGSPAEQLEIAKEKAGIGPGEPFKIYRFTVRRHL